MMKHEAIRIVNGQKIVSDITEMQLAEILEQASFSAIVQAAIIPPESTHREWDMVLKDAIESEGRIYRVEGPVRITEATSREEGVAWFNEVQRYWQALNDQEERKEAHGSK